MQDGAAKLLATHLSSPHLDPTRRRVFQRAFDRLISRDPKNAWTSGQWMTERRGGSDVSLTETIATHAPFPKESTPSDEMLGPWSIDGFKWFSSATDSSMTVMLAQTPKGLSAFFAPMYRASSAQQGQPSSLPEKELNGITISRLKNKFGTKSLPTAELELKGTRAYLVGNEGQGIKEISAVLTMTRLYTAMTTAGYVGRGLGIARAFTRVREVGAGRGRRVALVNSPLHMNTLAKLTGNLHAMNLFVFFVAWLLGISEHQNISTTKASAAAEVLKPGSQGDVDLLLRALTSIVKAVVSKRGIHTLQECMEALGGVGYLDNSESEAINVARLFRDCCVQSIWEGTTDVLATDTVRVFKGRQGNEVLDALDRWVRNSLSRVDSKFAKEKESLSGTWGKLRRQLEGGDQESLTVSGREIMFNIADIIVGILLLADAQQDMDPAFLTITRRYLNEAGITQGDSEYAAKSVKATLELNQIIVFGNPANRSEQSISKL